MRVEPYAVLAMGYVMHATAHTRDQPHPLYARDRQVVDRILQASGPSDQLITDAARLLNRYDGFPGARDISRDIVKAARGWGFSSRDDLNRAARGIWSGGFRPTLETSEVGSGADVAAGAAAG